MLEIVDCIEDTFNAIRSCDLGSEDVTNYVLSKFEYIMENEKIGITDIINVVREYDARGEILPLSVFSSLFTVLDSRSLSR